jgi:hypothetical protein
MRFAPVSLGGGGRVAPDCLRDPGPSDTFRNDHLGVDDVGRLNMALAFVVGLAKRQMSR